MFLRLRVLPSRDFPNLHQFPGSQRAWHAAQRLVMIYIKYESSNMILSLGKPAQHKALFITFQLFSLPWVTVVYYTIKSCTFRAFQIKPYCTRFLSKSFLFHEGRNLCLQSSCGKGKRRVAAVTQIQTKSLALISTFICQCSHSHGNESRMCSRNVATYCF